VLVLFFFFLLFLFSFFFYFWLKSFIALFSFLGSNAFQKSFVETFTAKFFSTAAGFDEVVSFNEGEEAIEFWNV
jgi:hypothetical protein